MLSRGTCPQGCEAAEALEAASPEPSPAAACPLAAQPPSESRREEAARAEERLGRERGAETRVGWGLEIIHGDVRAQNVTLVRVPQQGAAPLSPPGHARRGFVCP